MPIEAGARVNDAGRRIEHQLARRSRIQQPALEHQRRDGDDAVPAHRAVALVVHEQHAGVGTGALGARQQRAVHVGVAARLEHDRRAQMVVVFAQPFTTLEHRLALRLGKAVDNEPQRFPCGVRVQRSDCHHGADMPLLLAENDVRSLLTMPDLIAAMRPAHDRLLHRPRAATAPHRAGARANRAFFGSMPASLHDPAAVGTKLVTVFASNHARGLPSHLATIVLFDPETGALMAILDGRYITEARTAAVSALSADVLARRDAGILAILGSGVQARSHLEALGCVRTLREVRVWSPTESHRNAFAREMEPLAGVRITPAESPALAVEGADLIVAATTSTTAADRCR